MRRYATGLGGSRYNVPMQRWLGRGDVRLAIVAGVAYGVLAQLVARLDMFQGLLAVMSAGYIFVLPVVLGVVTASIVAHRGRWALTLGAALACEVLCLLVAFAIGWEGSICLVMAAPIYLLCGLLGAVIGHLSYRRRPAGPRSWALLPLLLLPQLSAALETTVTPPSDLREVRNSVVIAAAPEQVWQQIVRVRPITEHQESFFYAMGFPKPVEATLSHDGVGGVRHASFERGLLFIETVTRWESERLLRFTIEVDPAHTPLTTLDTHVTVGGPYFDVLEGGYRIEPLSGQRVRLHLDSQHRLSTRYNLYASLWSDFLMSDVQRNILNVIKQRCERAEK